MVLHITNGDSAAGTLRDAVPGTVATWMDVLHEGPVPPLPRADLIAVRARYGASRGYAPEHAIRAMFQGQEDTLRATARHAETVLWFEHDLFDQLLLVQLLDRLATLDPKPLALTLVCIGEFPGIERFVGLGQLSATQMASLFPSRLPVTERHFETARGAWNALMAPTPEPLERLASDDIDALPFLGDALRRLLAEYPSCDNGLGLTERRALEALAAGAASGQEIFWKVHAAEPRPFLGDTSFYAILRDLATARRPLVAADGAGWQAGADSSEPGAVGRARFSLTDLGGACLQGLADAVAENGIDRWVGGVHLNGRDAAWRWDIARGVMRRT